MSLRLRGPVRQTALFVLAVMLPCGVLLLLTLRILSQERELRDKRTADERRWIVADVRRKLVDEIERQRSNPSSADVVLRLEARQGWLALPWDGSGETASALQEPAFRDALRTAEAEEFGAAGPLAAAGHYRQAGREARTPVQHAAADLLTARALLKANRPGLARPLVARLLAVPLMVADEEGVPYALYAARLLSDRAVGTDATAAAVTRLLDVASVAPLRPETAYMVTDLARRIGQTRIAAVAEDHARDMEQAVALRTAYTRLVAPGTAGATAWLPFGPPERRWLVGTAADASSGAVTVVRLAPVVARIAADIHVDPGPGDDSLAPEFPGLHVRVAEGAIAAALADSRLQRRFYLAAVVLAISVATFSGYLFWRDVRREVRLAELRGQFVSSVSHELKTPLTAIRIFAETLMLGRSLAPDVQQEYLETIVNESERLTRLLNNVLDFSQMERGRKTYRLEPLAPAAIVRTAVKAMRYPLSQQGFDLRVAIDDTVPPVRGEADPLEQAVLNLLSNAMKYSGDARVIDVAVTRDGGNAVIAVTDRGIGIAASEHGRIFERFYRVAGEPRQRVPGTGLGLTLVDHVVSGHGGRIAVRSAPGEGSTFAILLPLAPPPAPAESAALA